VDLHLSKDALVADAVLGRQVETKEFYWEVEGSVGGCGLGGAQLTLRRDGSASWRGVVNSIYSDDAYCVTLSFFNSGGRKLFDWPRFCSQTLLSRNNSSIRLRLLRGVTIVERRGESVNQPL
jgi:hypothetical protein